MFSEYEDMVTVENLCEMLHIGKNAAYQMLKEQTVHAFKIGRIWKISKQSVIDYIAHNTETYH